MNSKQSKYILFLGGGGFAGAFGLGVLRGFREQGLREHIDAVYGASAGVLNGAHFLTGQEENYLPIFLDPSMSSLVHPENIPKALWHSWRHGITHDKKGVDIFDIETKEKIYRARRTLDMQKLQMQSIPLYASIYNFRKDQMEHVDVRRATDPYALITAASAAAPLWGRTGFFEDTEYLDGAIKEPLAGQYLLNKYPSSKIIVVMNDTASEIMRGNFSGLVEKSLISRWARTVLGKNAGRAYSERQKILREEYSHLLGHPRVITVTIPEEYTIFHFKSNPEKIAKLHDIGLLMGKKVASHAILDQQNTFNG